MDQLTPKSTEHAANNRVLFLIQEGITQEEAFLIVSRETDRSSPAIKSYFHWHGGHNEGTHGNCKLTKEEEDQLISMMIVFSMMHEAISIKSIQKYVENIFLKKKWQKLGRRLYEKAPRQA